MVRTFEFLLPYLMRYRRKYILGALFLIITNLFRILNPKIIQQAIDYLRTSFSMSELAVYALLVVLVAVGEGVFLFLMRRFMIVASREIENDLRNDFFECLLAMPASFFNRMKIGDIMSRATNDLAAVRSVVGPGIAYATNTLMAFIFVIPMMLYISPRLTLFALLPFPIVALLVNRFGKAIYKRFQKVQDQLSILTSHAQENLSGSAMVKWFTREDYETEQFRRKNEEYMDRNIDHAKVFAAFRPALMLTIGIAVAIILLIGGRLIINGTITLGEFTAFLMYMNILVFPSIALGWVIGLLQQGAASMDRMRIILEAEPDLNRGSFKKDVQDFQGEIHFNNLDFGYAADTPVLHQINLHIERHQTVGIIGPTGSGKSSLIKLIPNLYKLPAGKLVIDGVDITEYDLANLRAAIGYVPQESFLFSDSIANNISYSSPDATMEEIEWAARMADVHDQIIEFPNGYQSLLGEKGLNLSGGQKQRLSMARAILRKPQILILDDAFSALDTETEARILDNLNDFLPDRTVIIVSHRVSTLQNADQIIVLEDGHIIERGSHESLILMKGHYAWIHQRQLLERELAHTD